MRVRLRPDVVRGSGAAVAAQAGAAAKAAPKKKAAEPRHARSPCCSAPTWARPRSWRARSPRRARRRASPTTLAGLDDQAGRLPAEGAVAIVCASYNGGPPDNAGAFIKSLRDGRRRGSLTGVRYTVFGCGNRDWASTYQAIPRQIDELLADKGAERIYARGEGDAKEDLDGHFQAWNEPLLPALADKLGVKLEADAARRHEPLYQVQAVDKPPANPIIGGDRRAADARARQPRAAEAPTESGAQHAAYRGAAARRRQLPRRRSSQHRAAERRGAGRAGDARASAFAPGAHVMLAAAEGRRAALPVGEAIAVHRLLSDFVELQHPATRKQIQHHGAAHALSVHAAQARGAARRGALPGGDPGQAQVGARPAGGAIRPASCRSRRSSKCCR